jgi:hypothetical protein
MGIATPTRDHIPCGGVARRLHSPRGSRFDVVARFAPACEYVDLGATDMAGLFFVLGSPNARAALDRQWTSTRPQT